MIKQTQKVYLYDPRSDTIERTFECDAAVMAVSQDGTTLAMDCIGKGITVWQGSADPPTITSAPPLDIKALHSGGLDGSLLLLDSEGWIWKRNPTSKAMERSADTRIGSVYSCGLQPRWQPARRCIRIHRSDLACKCAVRRDCADLAPRITGHLESQGKGRGVFERWPHAGDSRR